MTEYLAIIGGSNVESQSSFMHPFFVSIHVGDKLCGGTVIREDAVVTSAECLFDPRRKGYVEPHEIEIFKQNEVGPPTRFNCERFSPHWMFAWDRKSYGTWATFDIAVLKLRDWIDFRVHNVFPLRPCSPNQEYKEGFAVGMGEAEVNGGRSKQARRRNRNPVSNRAQKEVFLRKDDGCSNFLKETGLQLHARSQLCFQSIDPGSLAGISTGDFGGPLVYQDRFVMCLLGVASFSVATRNQSSIISVFTSAPHNNVFIKYALESRIVNGGCDIL